MGTLHGYMWVCCTVQKTTKFDMWVRCTLVENIWGDCTFKGKHMGTLHERQHKYMGTLHERSVF